MKAGDAFLLYDDSGYSGKPHLHIVISDPDLDGRVVLVSVTTRRAKSDTMVCISPGHHPFIEQESVITYAYSKLLTVSKINELIAAGDAFPKDTATSELLRRAQAGMLETERAPREVQAFFRAGRGI